MIMNEKDKNKKENKPKLKRAVMPFNTSLMQWLVELDVLGIETKNDALLKVKALLNGDYNKPIRLEGNTKTTYETYYKNGFSINEIAELFGVSKQYVDNLISQSNLKEDNLESRISIKMELEYVAYVLIPEKFGFNKLREFGIRSHVDTLKQRYKAKGGKSLEKVLKHE